MQQHSRKICWKFTAHIVAEKKCNKQNCSESWDPWTQANISDEHKSTKRHNEMCKKTGYLITRGKTSNRWTLKLNRKLFPFRINRRMFVFQLNDKWRYVKINQISTKKDKKSIEMSLNDAITWKCIHYFRIVNSSGWHTLWKCRNLFKSYVP